MLTELRAALKTAKGLLLVAIILLGVAALAVFYWRAQSNATTKNDLRVARETIKYEREALKITHQIDMRVNLEGIQTAQTSEAATDEIEAIRKKASLPADGSDPPGTVRCDADCTRVLQLAREARAAALASSARLQSARTGAR